MQPNWNTGPVCPGAELAAEKKALRRICRAKLSLLPPAEHTAQPLCEALRALPAYKRARTVFCYVSTGSEAATQCFLQAVLADGKALCVPWCEGPGVMRAKQLQHLGQLEEGVYGIPAPPASAPTVPPQAIDFAVVPCLAADTAGNRLGHGGGFYDRFLPQLPATAFMVVLCRAGLLLPPGQIPLEPHDIPAHAVLTQQALYSR